MKDGGEVYEVFHSSLKRLSCGFYEADGLCLKLGIGLNTFSIWNSKCG